MTDRPRRPWLAGLMAAATGGFGHLYLGRWKAAIAIPIVVFCGTALALTIVLALGGSSLAAILTGGVVGFLLWATQIAAAVTLARKAPVDYALRGINRAWIYVLWFVLVQGIAAGPALAIRANVMELFKIPSDSMQPALIPGDILAVPKIGPQTAAPMRVGELAVFHYPPEPTTKYVKRIVGLAGDEVRVERNRLEIEGKVRSARCNQPDTTVTDLHGRAQRADCWMETRSDGASWPILVARSRARSPGSNFGPTTVGPSELLVFGDYRTNSSDSRAWGAVKDAQVIGRPDQIIWSWDRSTGLDLARIGTRLQPAATTPSL